MPNPEVVFGEARSAMLGSTALGWSETNEEVVKV
jgi:hypothetical protein